MENALHTERRTVTYIIHSLERFGGTERHLSLLLSSMPSPYDGNVVCLFRCRQLSSLSTKGYPCHALNIHSLWSVGGVIRAWALLFRLPTELFHAYGEIATLIVAPVAYLRRIPLVSARRNEGPNNRTWWWHALSRIATWVANVTTVNSPAVGAAVDSHWQTRKDIRLIRNGVELPPDPQPYPCKNYPTRSGHGPIVVSVSNFRPVKNLPLLINAAATVSKTIQEVGFVLVGDGPDRSDIEALIANLGLQNVVTLLGYRSDVQDLLAKADLFVISSNSEGSPNAVIEAMANGLPVIGTAVGGIPDLVTEHVGILVRANGVEEMAQAIISLLQDPETRGHMAHEARKQAVERFSIQHMCADQAALYDFLILN